LFDLFIENVDVETVKVVLILHYSQKANKSLY